MLSKSLVEAFYTQMKVSNSLLATIDDLIISASKQLDVPTSDVMQEVQNNAPPSSPEIESIMEMFEDFLNRYKGKTEACTLGGMSREVVDFSRGLIKKADDNPEVDPEVISAMEVCHSFLKHRQLPIELRTLNGMVKSVVGHANSIYAMLDHLGRTSEVASEADADPELELEPEAAPEKADAIHARALCTVFLHRHERQADEGTLTSEVRAAVEYAEKLISERDGECVRRRQAVKIAAHTVGDALNNSDIVPVMRRVARYVEDLKGDLSDVMESDADKSKFEFYKAMKRLAKDHGWTKDIPLAKFMAAYMDSLHAKVKAGREMSEVEKGRLVAIEDVALGRGDYGILDDDPRWSTAYAAVCELRKRQFEEEVRMMSDVVERAKTYFVSGHLDITALEFQEHYFPNIMKAYNEGAMFVVGDAKGADLMVQEHFARCPGRLIVYHMHEKPRHIAGNFMTRGGYESDESRDADMTALSDADIAWVRPGRETSGTARNIKRRYNKRGAVSLVSSVGCGSSEPAFLQIKGSPFDAVEFARKTKECSRGS